MSWIDEVLAAVKAGAKTGGSSRPARGGPVPSPTDKPAAGAADPVWSRLQQVGSAGAATAQPTGDGAWSMLAQKLPAKPTQPRDPRTVVDEAGNWVSGPPLPNEATADPGANIVTDEQRREKRNDQRVADGLAKMGPMKDGEKLPGYTSGDKLKERAAAEDEAKAQDERRTTRAGIVSPMLDRTVAEMNGEPAPADVGKMTKAMTQEEYNGLSDRQRAAVDYNTLLTEAVARDVKNQDKYLKLRPDSDEVKSYNKLSEKMFGDDRGSEMYAPETLDVLRQLKLTSDDAADLDDYLSLKAAITDKDLKTLDLKGSDPYFVGKSERPAGPRAEATTREDYVSGLADRAVALQKSLAEDEIFLDTIGNTAAAARGQFATGLGAEPRDLKPSLGFGKTPDDVGFQGFYDMLKDPGQKDLNAIVAGARGQTTPDEFASLLGYIDTRTSNEMNYGLKSAVEGARKPDEIRAALGLDKE